MKKGFAIWLTGRPACGKSTTAKELAALLEAEDVNIQVLESDDLRKVLTPEPTYSQQERDWFYGVLLYLGKMLTEKGVNVVFDATGNKRAYRDRARSEIERFAEVYVRCPQEVIMARDPKGIYQAALQGKAPTVPGLGTTYEAPEKPEVVVESDKETPTESAQKILTWLKTHWLS